jgi:hypothetical protein
VGWERVNSVSAAINEVRKNKINETRKNKINEIRKNKGRGFGRAPTGFSDLIFF